MFPVFGGNSPDDQYKIPRSLRFNSADSAYLSRTPAAAGNRKTFTLSMWVKRTVISAQQTLFCSNPNSSTNGLNISFGLNTADDIGISDILSASNQIRCSTTALFRDPSAWYHIVVAIDTTQATNSNGVKLWVNGVQQTLTFNNYVQNASLSVNNSVAHEIGRFTSGSGGSGNYANGYITEFYFIDGAALGPEHFGETDAITGVWKPKIYEDKVVGLEYLVIGGGGAGAAYGGGGAGGYRSSVLGESSGGGSSAEDPLSLTTGRYYQLTVGAGGVGGADYASTSGNNTSLATISSIGGGKGGTNGGAGGGMSQWSGTSDAGPGTSSQGYGGGAGSNVGSAPFRGGGGGGAGGAGGNGSNSTSVAGCNGGSGVLSSITGVEVTRAGGGGGGTYGASSNSYATSTGGTGGGGNGGKWGGTLVAATAGTANTGSGGGAYSPAGGNGGSGVAILRYPSTYTATFSAGVTQTTSTVGTNKVSVITAAGPTDTVTFA